MSTFINELLYWYFIKLIWDELKAYFNKYDIDNNGWLTKQEFKDFIKEVLAETSTSDLNYIFWSMFRVDID